MTIQLTIISLPFTDQEIKLLDKDAEKAGLTRTEFCKRLIDERPGQVKLTDSVRDYFDQRVITSFFGERIHTINDLVSYDLSRLWRVPGIGKMAHKEIETFLLDHSLISEPIQKK